MKDMFNEFKGLDVRTELPQKDDPLFKVFELEEEIIRTYSVNDGVSFIQRDGFDTYQEIIKYLDKKLEKSILTPRVLETYVDSRENIGRTNETLARGVFSGALLELVCRKNNDAPIFLFGRGKQFDYLFSRAILVQNVYLENIQGHSIFTNAGREGIIESLTVNNIVGNQLLAFSAKYGGTIKNVFVNNICGDCLFLGAGEEGRAEYILANNIKGLHSFQGFARLGYANHVLLTDMRDPQILTNQGRIDNLIRDKDMNPTKERLLRDMQKIVETYSSKNGEERKSADKKMKRLQEEIFQ